jgi:hypothetical protein
MHHCVIFVDYPRQITISIILCKYLQAGQIFKLFQQDYHNSFKDIFEYKFNYMTKRVAKRKGIYYNSIT